MKKVVTLKVVTLVTMIAVLSTLPGCACSSPANRNTVTCAVVNGIVSCTESSVAQTITEFLPVVLGLVVAFTAGDGTVDWAQIEKAFTDLGLKDGGCLLAELQAALGNLATGPGTARVPPLLAQVTPARAGVYAAGLAAYRAKRWPGIRYHTTGGDL